MKKPLIVVGIGLAAVVLTMQPASAKGGWAITSLDAVPAPVAGEPIAVGFTILQHGVSPVNPDGGGVAVLVRDEAGKESSFDARQEGPVGHFVADVEFPATGAFTWAVEQGWFGEFDLGSIDVAPGSATPAAPANPVEVPSVEPASEPVVLRILLPLVALAGLGLLALDIRAHAAANRGVAAG